ncbi:hypothetical protein VTL71DRAFT_6027 [Oculimacula yallundae]|uniref:Polyketide synthase n=1 Tax=Oculimacula yallundae TaxID=86028 RepID=A0ABR4BZ58_9HELO
MLSTASQVFVFGDQTSLFENDLKALLHVKDNESLRSFFEKANYGLRVEISKLSITQRELFPRFTSILDLLQHYRTSGGNPAMGLSLLTLNHLGRFIKYYGEDSRPYPVSSNSYAIGLCTGSFAAAAISTSHTISELIPAALEAVLVAFRTGLASIEARDDIEYSQQLSAPWSVIVALQQCDAEAGLSAFASTKNGLPRSSTPYLSAITTNSVTISGPPSILQELLQTTPFAFVKPVKLSVYAPYHASHIYNVSVVDNIIAASDANILSTYMPRIPVISCSTGRRVAASNYGALLRQILRDILIEQLRWDLVLQHSSMELIDPAFPGAHLNIIPVLTNSATTLATAMSQAAVDHSVSTDSTKPSSSTPSGKPEQSKIAIVGHSGRFPDAASTEDFWQLLHEGLDVHRPIPADRFDGAAHFDPSGKKKNTSRVNHGCFIEEPGLFDARFFNMSPRESLQADPGQRLAITTAYEAMEMAGFVPDRTASSQRDRTGIFYGMTSDDWREVNSGIDVDTYFIPGGNRAFTPGRINWHFKFSGPSFSIDTACSSSFAAIHTACNSLWRGDCDMAIAGGTNVMTNPDNFAGLDRGHFLSTTGNCNTFDDAADGYCRADAVGTVILKRLEDAQADKDPIYGVLLGAYTNHSAESESMTRPHVGAQAFIFNKMLNQANVSPLDVSLIEMHGTGTQAGDAVEMKSVLEVFAKQPRGADHPLHLGSAKANVGHSESASGVTSLIKVLMMMNKNEIPPHCGIKTKINHGFPTDLKERNVHIALKPTPWRRPQHGKRMAFLNNFSAAGGNTALLLEDAPPVVPASAYDGRSTHLVTVSAKSIVSLEKNILSMILFIDNAPELSLPALSYTTTARRMHHNHRVVVTGHDLLSIKIALQSALPCKDVRPFQAAKVAKIAFAFTGQGALYSGVAKTLFETISQFRSDVQRFDRIAQSQGFPTFIPLIDGSATSKDALGPVVAQLGAVSVQIALTRLWASWGVLPSTVIGHSLGEYAALCAAGVLSISDTIYLTGARASLLEECCSAGTHSMLAIKASLASINSYLARTICEIACINGPEEIVLSGSVVEIATLSNELTATGIKCMQLDVPFAFHSAQVEVILEKFEALAQHITFKKPSVPYISPLLSEVVTESGIIGANYLSRACRETVSFQGGLMAAMEAKVISEKNIWIEIGPHPVCCGMIKSNLGYQITTLSTLRKNTDTWKVIAGSLASLYTAGFDLRWNEYHRDFEGCQQAIQLPAYAWDSKTYWIQGNVNNFCLTKGDLAPEPVTKLPQPVRSSLSTTSVQRVVEEHHGADQSTLTIESDVSDPILSKVFHGHKVNGTPLCPSSLYADIGLTMGRHLLTSRPDFDELMDTDVADMKVGKPMIASGAKSQLFRVSAVADWSKQVANVKIYSVNAQGKKTTDHATCLLKFGDREAWAREWTKNSYLINSRIVSLQGGVNDGQSHKIKRGIAYKLFGCLVDYSPSYRGMEEVVIDSTLLEATAQVKFKSTASDGNFDVGPYWIDSLGHIAGFIMNATDSTDSAVQVFINHGWDRMRVATDFTADKTYQVYNRMQHVEGTMYSGDTYIFDNGKIVAVYEGVKFQGVPRSVLDHLRPAAASAKLTRVVPAMPALTPTTIKVPDQKQTITIQKSSGSNTSQLNLVQRALAIVSEEIGVSTTELVPTADFSDFGVDSLLSLNITSRFREELELEVESSLFADCPTVKDLLAFLPSNTDTPLTSASISMVSTPDLEHMSATTSNTDGIEYSVIDLPSADDSNLVATIRLTIAEEVGIPLEELTGSLSFSDIGMDSLLSLTVLGKLREVLGTDLDGNLFQDNDNLDEIQAALFPKQPVVVTSETKVQTVLTKSVSVKAVNVSHPPTTSIMLQGNPKTASKILFLFPDGSGSATSYAPLPKVSPDVVIYGLNCPYMRHPEKMTCSLDELTPIYLDEIRRRQPHGPYYFGGWSAGGICAFDAAQQLDREGEIVERLILIDSPFPIGLEKLPPRLYDFFGSIGMFGEGDKAPPSWLLPHFLAFVDSLDRYQAKPFMSKNAPQTHIIWARDGVCKKPSDPRPEMKGAPREMLWLLNNRKDFGANGWDGLLGKAPVVRTMDDANHFTMMAGEKVHELAAFIKSAMM